MKKSVWMKWCAAVVCVCLVTVSAVSCSDQPGEKKAPEPELVQVGNPLVEVASHDEMEKMLDFSVPVLEKEVSKRIVLVMNGLPTIGRMHYADGGVFNMKYGSGDISGIYGGVEQYAEKVGDIQVTYCVYEDTRYAIWEHNGFTYSLTGDADLEDEVEYLLS